MGEMDYLDLPVHLGNQALPVSLRYFSIADWTVFFFFFFSFSCANSVIISIIIMCFQLDPYDCRVEFDVAYNKNCSNKFVGSYLCAFYHILQEKTSRLYHIRCLARRKTVAILRSYNRIYKSTMRSFIARQIANKRSRVQNGFDQILPKRSGYEIEFRIW